MQFIKGGFSYRAKKELGMGMEIWERGYIDHRIRDGMDYARHVEYIRQNPVRARLVSRAEDYEWSSAHGDFELNPYPQGLKPPSLRLA
jgi:putative transposase